MNIRVLHCDDSEAFRVLVREMLLDEDGIEIVGQAESSEAAIALARELRPDVLLLDLRGGDLSESLPAAVAAAAPAVRIVVLSGWLGPIDETHVAVRLSKDIEFPELAQTLREIGGAIP
jgi:DNA-binding NarL/FixJ family response regulator